MMREKRDEIIVHGGHIQHFIKCSLLIDRELIHACPRLAKVVCAPCLMCMYLMANFKLFRCWGHARFNTLDFLRQSKSRSSHNGTAFVYTYGRFITPTLTATVTVDLSHGT